MSLTILDGAFGTDAYRTVKRYDWTTKEAIKYRAAAVFMNPELHPDVVAIHRTHLESGADCVTTGNYHVIRANGRFSLEEVAKYARVAGECARKAVKEFKEREAEVLGSLPPLGPSHNPSKILPHEEMVKEYSVIAKALEPSVDRFVAETLTHSKEAVAVLEALKSSKECTGKPVWVSFAVNEGKLFGGETLDDAIATVLKNAGDLKITALLINCSTPDSTVAGLKSLSEATKKTLNDLKIRLGAYGNLLPGESLNKLGKIDNGARPPGHNGRVDMSPEQFYSCVEQWKNLGCTILGGCCQTKPEHIKHMAEQLKKRGTKRQLPSVVSVSG